MVRALSLLLSYNLDHGAGVSAEPASSIFLSRCLTPALLPRILRLLVLC